MDSFSWKVTHQNTPNDAIPGMKSDCKQPYFRAGGSQVSYYLGVQGNYPSPVGLPVYQKTATEKVLTSPVKKVYGVYPSYLFSDI